MIDFTQIEDMELFDKCLLRADYLIEYCYFPRWDRYELAKHIYDNLKEKNSG